MPRGGARPGSGCKKGFKAQKTLDKIEAREFLRQRVIAEMGAMLTAQIAHAKGLSYLMVRDKAGKFTKVSAAAAKQFTGEEILEVWEKDPSVQAFTDLLNRALDKPKEQEQEIDLKAELRIRWQ